MASPSASSPASGSASVPHDHDLVPVVARPPGGPVNQPSGRRPANQPWSLVVGARAGVLPCFHRHGDYSITSIAGIARACRGWPSARPPASSSSAYLLRGQKKPAEAVLAVAGDDVDVQVRDALAHDVVHRHERALRAHGVLHRRRDRCTCAKRPVARASARSREGRDVLGAGTTSVWPGNSGPVIEERDARRGVEHEMRRHVPRDDRAEQAARGPVTVTVTPGDVYGRSRGGRRLALGHHHLAPEVADLFAALVEAAGLDRDDAAVGLDSTTRASRAPWSPRRSCRRGTSGACAAATRPRGSRSPHRSRRARSCRAPASTRGCRPPRSCRTASGSRRTTASVCSGWWFMVIMQNRWSSASVIVLPGQCL